jgi:hypothetical protein
VARQAKLAFDEDGNASVMVLDATTSFPVEIDFRGTPDEVVARLAPQKPAEPGLSMAPVESAAPAALRRPAAPGRPRLGVVAREVTLLPRHWEWLNEQPGGASVTLRKLVEEARRSTAAESRRRRAQESCYRFMSIMAGDEPGYEEALRALYAGDAARFDTHTAGWPPDIRDQARRLAAATYTAEAAG